MKSCINSTLKELSYTKYFQVKGNKLRFKVGSFEWKETEKGTYQTSTGEITHKTSLCIKQQRKRSELKPFYFSIKRYSLLKLHANSLTRSFSGRGKVEVEKRSAVRVRHNHSVVSQVSFSQQEQPAQCPGRSEPPLSAAAVSASCLRSGLSSACPACL